MGRRHAAEQDQHLSHEGHARGGVVWPDWRGEICAIIASGPSAKKTDLSPLKGRAKVIAIKQNIDLCPWADVVYGCDAAWWRFRRGLPEYSGIKMCWAGNGIAKEFPDVVGVEIALNEKGASYKYSERLHFEPGVIGAGANSGFQAINLAVHFGAKRLILIGFDMTDRSGVHWYGRNHWAGGHNPDHTNFRRWIAALDRAAPVLLERGIEVINASTNSALQCFPKRSIEDALSEWQ